MIVQAKKQCGKLLCHSLVQLQLCAAPPKFTTSISLFEVQIKQQ